MKLKCEHGNCGKNNGMWKGNNVGHNSLHEWIKRRLPQPPYCEKCSKITNKLDLANISQKYLRKLDDWEWLCRKCHMTKDGRIKILKIVSISRRRKLKKCIICNKFYKPTHNENIGFCSRSCSNKYRWQTIWKYRRIKN